MEPGVRRSRNDELAIWAKSVIAAVVGFVRGLSIRPDKAKILL